jgi:hypothetical protein
MSRWTEAVDVARAVVAAGESVLMVGAPGSGKSVAADRIMEGRECERAVLSRSSGRYLVAARGLSGGDAVLEDGPAVRAVRRGVPLLVDELTLAEPEDVAALQGLMDGRPVLLPGGGALDPGRGLQVVATGNLGLTSTFDLSPAMLSRLVRVEVPRPEPGEVCAMLGVPESLAGVVGELWQAAPNANYGESVSLRSVARVVRFAGPVEDRAGIVKAVVSALGLWGSEWQNSVAALVEASLPEPGGES